MREKNPRSQSTERGSRPCFYEFLMMLRGSGDSPVSRLGLKLYDEVDFPIRGDEIEEIVVGEWLRKYSSTEIDLIRGLWYHYTMIYPKWLTIDWEICSADPEIWSHNYDIESEEKENNK